PDQITYNMPKNLPQISLISLLDAFNFTWCNYSVPEEWGKAIIIPILKPGKSKEDPSNYRPISLTNTICKTFEKI
ncbi:hypothetical protein HELRODRAFT_128414, partial [Helobdella robusta]|uniref:Reverse transcriptase domain-containing protein n=1 Tax=Helobdella robusta TaxID=6412 RepID=T1EHN0_HELRO